MRHTRQHDTTPSNVRDTIKKHASTYFITAALFSSLTALGMPGAYANDDIGKELSVPKHLNDNDEFVIGIKQLLAHGKRLFTANWTGQEGGGRPLSKGTGAPLADPGSPLVFPRNMNRISAPDANSCGGCHGVPRAGGGGDIVANVFVLGQRFDFATFDQTDGTPTRGTVNEIGNPTVLQTIANSRNTLGMFGSGFIEMLSRQITSDLQTIRNSIGPGQSAALASKGISYGVLSRNADGTWNTSAVEGLPATSLTSTGASNPPSLIIRPMHQAGAVISVREFTNNAFNHHHGVQTEERFGIGADPDGDGFVNEMTRADVTAATLFQTTLPVPGRVIPNDEDIEKAVLKGEKQFKAMGCTGCHIPALPLVNQGWVFTEPNPFNPPGNLRPGDGVPTLSVNLTGNDVPSPRLKVENGVVMVPAFTDLKLHDITTGPGDPNREALDMLQPGGSPGFFAGNGKFLTRKLWGIANEPPFFHHGQFATMRQAIEAHHGEAEASFQKWVAASDSNRDSIIEFLKTLQVLPEGTTALVVDENGKAKTWPPN